MNPERLPAEVAHVLFLDIVAFSRGSMEQQARLSHDLRSLVPQAPEFARGMEAKNLVVLDTGDGMALLFFRDPLAPLQCAVEIARSVTQHQSLMLRMGIHSGPVYRTTDLNGRENFTGSGINVAQRVMDCGDAGHILLSSRTAEVAQEFEAWSCYLHDLGECEVKHGKRVHLFNLVQDSAGRPDVPSRVLCTPDALTSPSGAASSGAAEIQPRVVYAAPTSERLGAAVPPGPHSGTESAAEPVRVGQAGQVYKVVLLCKQGSPSGEHLMGILESALKANGDDVFIDRCRRIDGAWAQEIERRIIEADAVVPLLSEASHRSEMLEFELQVAHQASQSHGGKPRILPVRVAFSEPLAEPIGSILEFLRPTLWNSEKDDAAVIAEVVRTLHGPPAAPTALKWEPVGGALPLDSQCYVDRPTDASFIEAIANRDSIVLVKGARQMGKTSLLARGLQQARAEGARVALTDFQTFSPSVLTSADSLLRALAEDLLEQLDLDDGPLSQWNPSLGANTNMERFVRRHVLGGIDGSLVWGLDEVDRLFPPGCSFGSEVFGLFRSWHNRRSLDPGGPWSRLTLSMAYATEAHLFITDLNQSPFNVGTRLELSDFSPAQTADMNERFGRPLPDSDSVARFHALLGGHPYLSARALDNMRRRDVSIDALEREADRDESMFGDHLRRILVTLSQDTQLTDVARGLLHGQPCPTPEIFYRMRSAGLISGTSTSDARFRCRLYESYLARHL
jgi:class 3 adenylate cyclase